MTDFAHERKAVRLREKQARNAEASRAAVIRNIMSTIEGRAWLWDVLAGCSVFSSTFTVDPHVTAFNEGQRAVGLALLADIMHHCPDSYIQAQREANVRRTIDERRSSAEPNGGDSGPSDDPADPDSTTEPDAA